LSKNAVEEPEVREDEPFDFTAKPTRYYVEVETTGVMTATEVILSVSSRLRGSMGRWSDERSRHSPYERAIDLSLLRSFSLQSQGLRILETRTAQIIQELGFMLDDAPAPQDGAQQNGYYDGQANGVNGGQTMNGW
jgi:hypothetical protein